MAAWTAADVDGTAALARIWWDLLADGVPQDVLTAPQAPGGASVASLQSETQQRLDAATGDLQREEAVKTMLENVSLAGRILRSHGIGPARHRGEIAGIHASAGGVPKRPVDAGTIGQDGLEGDGQADRRYHGRVWQALCLWSLEVIHQLQAESHPISPGAAGDNLTLAGVDWRSLRPGTRLSAGGALLELSLPALPCQKNAQWFSDGDFTRMSHLKHPGSSRWYATVLEPGRLHVGDLVIVEP